MTYLAYLIGGMLAGVVILQIRKMFKRPKK